MNEAAAKEIVLVRTIETADEQQEILTSEDRLHATRSARELAQWRGAETGKEPTAEHFLQQRAVLILQRLGTRFPAFAIFSQQQNGLRRLPVILPILAFLFGAGLDRITDPHRVDLLSLPLLVIVAWNLLTYLALLLWICFPGRGAAWADTALVKRLVGSAMQLPRKLPSVLAIGVSAFMIEWMRLSRPLTTARLAQMLHLSAAMFAFGAVCSLYVRGVLSAYGAGWESTFLSAPQLQTLLSTIFTPARLIFHIVDFSLVEIESLRFINNAPQALLNPSMNPLMNPLMNPSMSPSISPAGVSASALQAGARWVHLYAATILLLVILPRLLLAALASWRVRRLTKKFPLTLEQPYFRRLAGVLSGRPGVLRVLPYSFTVDEARDKGLAAIAVTLLGEHSRLMLRPSSDYGQVATQLPGAMHPDDPGIDLTAVLFNLAATPETQNHGEFLNDVLARCAISPKPPNQHTSHGNGLETPSKVVVMVDESGYGERLGQQAGSAQRLAQRIMLWQQFCQVYGVPVMIVNLLDPATQSAQAVLR